MSSFATRIFLVGHGQVRAVEIIHSIIITSHARLIARLKALESQPILSSHLV